MAKRYPSRTKLFLRKAVLATLLVPLEGLTQDCPAPFGFPGRLLVVGHEAVSIVSGDFNDDERVDLATANAGSDNVSVLIGRGNGIFEPQLALRVGDAPGSVAVADFNGDSRSDLAVANRASNDLSILLGVGKGKFQPEKRVPAADFFPGAGTLPLLTADFNKDGRADLATTVRMQSALGALILLGNGDGTFARPLFFQPAGGGRSLAAGDFDRDGLLDLATIDGEIVQPADGSILLGSGGGAFTPAPPFALSNGAVRLIALDLNLDRKVDLASANGGWNTLSVLLGRGDGTFEAELRIDAGADAQAVLAPDLNGDGRPDLVSAHISDDLSVRLGTDDGLFLPERRFPAGDDPRSIVATDLNDDGRVDVATANATRTEDPQADDVSILLGSGDGTLLAEERFAVGVVPWAMAAGDFNSDGRLDVATSNNESKDLSVLLGKAGGGFHSEVRYASGDASGDIAAVDVNGDRRLDLAVANYGDVTMGASLLVGRGDGTFEQHRELLTETHARSLVAGDFDADGAADIALVPGIYSMSQVVTILLGRGDGTFHQPERFVVGNEPYLIAAGDFNGDGRLDLATRNGSGDLSVLLGDRGGLFAPESRLPLPNCRCGDALATGDVNGDGRLDLVLGGPTPLVLIGNGDGSFLAGATLLDTREQIQTRSLVAADLDGDGRLDVATANIYENGKTGDVSVLLGRGDGTFLAEQRFRTGRFPADILAADVDGDRYVDLMTVNEYSRSVSVLRNLLGLDCNRNGLLDHCDITAGRSLDADGDGIPDECERPSTPAFRRGDCDADGNALGVVTDAVFLLNFLFLGGAAPPCLAACDANGDGEVLGVVTDAVYSLTFNFLEGPPPPAPFPDCGGGGPPDEALGCEAPTAGCPG